MNSMDIRRPTPGSMFLTITLQPKLYKYSSVTQFELTHGLIEHIFEQTVDDFEMIPEHTGQGNIHYHAWFKFSRDPQKILAMNKLRRTRSLGFIKLTPDRILTDEGIKKVHNYMNKDFDTTRKGLASVPKSCLICRPVKLRGLLD